MSEELQFGNSSSRFLRTDERRLIKFLLLKSSLPYVAKDQLGERLVIDMLDGGMGSVRFVPSQNQSRGRTLVEAEYTDSDGVLVSIALNLDKEDNLFELDFWKVDFSPLVRYPDPVDIVLSN